MSEVQSSRGARAAVVAIAIVGSSGALTPRAHAGGVESTVAGARAIGRGGAMVASAEGFDALRYNPARLHTGTRFTVGADTQLHVASICFDRADDPFGGPYETVCNEAPPGLVPQIGASIDLGDRVGIGIGILPPPAIAGLRFGHPDDGTITVDGQRVASPSRYANVVSDNLALWATVGVGVELHPKLRLGLAFGVGVVRVSNISFMSALPGSGPANDVRTAVGAVDRFVPRISFGLDFEPAPGLTLASVTTFTDDVRGDAALFVSGESGGGFSARVDGVRVEQAFGWEQTVGLRYGRPRWDLELDLAFQAHARTQQVNVDIPDDATLPVDASINGQPLGDLPEERTVERRWKDQLVARAGAEYEVVENRLRLRTGLSYESRGVEHGYESVENFLARRVGVHFGVGVEVGGGVELNVAYSRVFQPTTTVAPEDARIEQPTALRPDGASGNPVYVNAGTYSGALDVFAISILYRGRPVGATSP